MDPLDSVIVERFTVLPTSDPHSENEASQFHRPPKHSVNDLKSQIVYGNCSRFLLEVPGVKAVTTACIIL